MASGISIGVGADTRQFSQAVSRGVVEPLDGVADALTDITRDGDRAGDRLTDAMRDAQRGTQRLEDAHQDLGDVIRRESQRSSRAMVDDSDRSTTRISADLEEVNDEFKSNLSEVVSSFDGSFESIGDLAQGTLGGLVGSLGPMGEAIGAAGAIGIGLIIAAQGAAAEDTEKYKERVAELGQEFIDAGRSGETSFEFLVEKLQELATATDDVNLKELAKLASGAQSDFRGLAQAYAGNTDGLNELWRASERQIKALKAESAALDQTSQEGQRRAAELSEQIDYTERYQDMIGRAASAAREAAEQERNYADAGGYAMETRAAATDAYQSAIDDAVGAFDEFKNAETGAMDPAAYLAGIDARIAATSNFNTNVQSLATQFGLTDAEVQAILDQGLDFAPMLQSIKDAGLEGEFVERLRSAVGGGQEVLDNSDLTTTTEVDADTTEAEAATDAFTSTKRDTTIDAKANTQQAENQIRAAASAPYNATISVGADLSGAQADIDSFARRNRTVTVTANIVDRNGKPVY